MASVANPSDKRSIPWLWIVLATSLAGVLAGVRLLLVYGSRGAELSYSDAVMSGLMEWWLWIPLIPLGLALARRFEPLAPGASTRSTLTTLGVHVLAAVTLAFAHLLLFTFLTSIIRWLRFGDAWRLDFASPMLALFTPDLFTYGLLISLGWWRFNRRRLLDADELAAQAAAQLSPIEFQAGRGSLSLRPDEIDWVSAAGNYLELHVGGSTHLIRETLKSVHGRLGLERFVRIHRSTLVRAEAVAGVLNGAQPVVLVSGGERLPIGASYRKHLLERFGQSS